MYQFYHNIIFTKKTFEPKIKYAANLYMNLYQIAKIRMSNLNCLEINFTTQKHVLFYICCIKTP